MKKLFIISVFVLITMARAEERPSGEIIEISKPLKPIDISKQKYYDAVKSFDSSFIELKKNTKILETKIKHK